MKKTIALLLCLVMLFVVTACNDKTIDSKPAEVQEGDKSTETTDETVAPVEEKVELNFLVPSYIYIEDYETNLMTLWMEELTNVHVNWSTIPDQEQGREEKLTMLLASNELPDVFLDCSLSDAMISRYGVEEGLLLPLEDLIDEHMPNLNTSIDKFKGGVDLLRSIDGHIYSLPVLDKCHHCEHASKLWLYDPWMQKLGLDYPETTEDFYNVLKAFKDQDPNGNGEADEIPLVAADSGWHTSIDEFILNSFVYYDRNERGFYVKDGVVESSLNQEGYREGLGFLNRLYKEGLLYEGSLTQASDQIVMLTENEDAELVGATTGGWTGCFADFGGDRGFGFRPIAPLEGSEGVRIAPTYPSLPGKGDYVLSAKCVDPVAAVKYADILYTQEATLNIRAGGMEGNFWSLAEEGQKSFEGEQAVWMQLEPWNDTEPQNESWIAVGVWDYTDLRANQAIKPEAMENMWSTDGLEYMLYTKTMDLYVPYEVNWSMPPMNFTTEEQEEIATLQTDLENYYKSAQFNFITGNTDLDSDWEKYLTDLDKTGLNKLIELYQTVYDRQYN